MPVYAESDRHFVEKKFLTPLTKQGYLIFDHHLNFMPGNVIADNILIAVKESRFVLPVITKNFLKSKYCVFELEQSVIKMIKTKTTCIIPVTADLALLPECLKNLVTSVILDEKDPIFSTHIDRIKNNIGVYTISMQILLYDYICFRFAYELQVKMLQYFTCEYCNCSYLMFSNLVAIY